MDPDPSTAAATEVATAAGPDAGAGAWRRATAIVLIALAASRLLARWAGVRTDTSWLDRSWQLADTTLLAHDPWGTAWSLHTQPPLYNLGVGSVLRWSPLSTELSFTLLHLALGVVLALSVLDLARSLGARPVPATVATVLAVCSPAALLYESWAFYTYPVAVAVTAAGALVARWVRSGRFVAFAGVCALATAATLTRSLLHPLWLVAVLALVVLARPPRDRRALAAGTLAVCLVAVGAVVVRNQVLTGEPGTSSWFWMNTARVTVAQLPADTRDAMVADGRLSPVAGVGAFRDYEQYEPVVAPCQPEHPDDPVLSRPRKANGQVNLAYECYLPLFDASRDDTLAALREDPGTAVRSFLAATHISLMPSGDYFYLNDNRDRLGLYDRAYRSLVLVTVPAPAVVPLEEGTSQVYQGTVPISLTALAGLVAVVVLGVQSLVGWRRHGPTAARAAAVYVLLTTAVVVLAGNAFELGENNRFRWIVEPAMFAVLAVVVQLGLDRFRAARQAG